MDSLIDVLVPVAVGAVAIVLLLVALVPIVLFQNAQARVAEVSR